MWLVGGSNQDKFACSIRPKPSMMFLPQHLNHVLREYLAAFLSSLLPIWGTMEQWGPVFQQTIFQAQVNPNYGC